MESLLQNLLKGARNSSDADEQFKANAKYYASMDFMLYLKEDCSYRADRIDQFLTVLWHPNEHRLVGIKLKGFKFLFQRLTAVMDNVKDEDFAPLVKIMEFAIVGGIGEAYIDEHQDRMKLYEQAKQLVVGVRFDTREILADAA